MEKIDKQKILKRHYCRQYSHNRYWTNKEKGLVNVRLQVSPLIKDVIMKLIKSINQSQSHENTIFQTEKPNPTK